jgi:hypothetical protein
MALRDKVNLTRYAFQQKEPKINTLPFSFFTLEVDGEEVLMDMDWLAVTGEFMNYIKSPLYEDSDIQIYGGI